MGAHFDATIWMASVGSGAPVQGNHASRNSLRRRQKRINAGWIVRKISRRPQISIRS